MTNDKPLVTGEITFENGAPSFSGAVVTVRLEDIGMMDAPARVLIEKVMRNVTYNGAGSIPFTLAGNLPETSRGTRYNVSAHVSLNDAAEVRKGDYITKQTYPVLKDHYPDTVTLRVERV